jgi:hypothetical protein
LGETQRRECSVIFVFLFFIWMPGVSCALNAPSQISA